ncbi:Tetratricopeptide repeat-containing protein [Amycolatopsis xylanica]|uniref:Tetratricopeptide repeat-containing protein n=1 Tax=Amycolatopsis xylanica TaxID=589385 RepID=A0A1H2VKF5_9PSEU|nr:tetratricopeptide repeat protein [Amycolatopsis xylanica]SDW68424.1 Tetratricopeptide repeat-containing protein [Amycolatopsis xylanica]
MSTSTAAAAAPVADIPVPADYDGDGRLDEAVWRPGDGTWRVQPAAGGPAVTRQWGQAGDLPVPGVYGGAAHLAVLRPADGKLYAKPFTGDGPSWDRPWATAGYVPTPEDHSGMITLANALNVLANVLSSAGRHGEAVVAARYGRDLWRSLAGVDHPGYDARFAWASVMLGAYASNAGLHDEAFQVTTEGAERYRALGDRPNLAWALDNLAMRYSTAGKLAEAVPPARERRDICRALAEADPAQRGGFGHAAVMLGAHASNAKLHDEAIAATIEGAEAFRAIPDQPQLAWALDNLAMRYSTAGKLAEAVPPMRECRDIYRTLAATTPAYRSDWAHADVMLGAHASNAKLFDEAIEANKDGIEAYRALGDKPSLAWALGNLAMRCSTAGRLEEAVPPARECRDVYRDLGQAHRPDWGWSAVMLGAHASNAKLYDEAIAATREGVEVFRDLDLRPNLAWALGNLAMRYSTAGKLAEAVPPARECRDVYRDLGEAHRPDWGWSAVMLGAHASNAKLHDEAIEATKEGVQVYRDLDARPNLAWALNNLCLRCWTAGRLAEAVDPQRECRDIYRALAETDPAGYRPNWAEAALQLAYLLVALERRSEAVNAALEAVRLFTLLTAANPVYAPRLEAAKKLLLSLQGTYTGGGLITAVHAPATATPGETIQVSVELASTAPEGTVVTVNGLTAREVRLQASTRPGMWRVPITAIGDGQAEERVLIIEIAGQPATALLEIARNPFRPLSVFIRASEIDTANPVLRQGDVYHWRVGSVAYSTGEPVFAADLSADVDHGRQWTTVLAQLDVQRGDATVLTVSRSLVLGSSYRVLRDQAGQIRPPVETDGRAVQIADRDSHYRGTFTVRNLEPVAVSFTKKRVEWTGDEDELTRFSDEETHDVTVAPGASATVEVTLDRAQGHGAHGAVVHLFGQTADAKPVHTSAAFSLVRATRALLAPHKGFVVDGVADPARFATIVNEQQALPLSVEVEKSGTVRVRTSAPEGLTQEHVWALRRAADYSQQASAEWFAPLSETGIVAADGDVVQGADCDPDNPPAQIPENFACQFTGETKTKEIPARVVNARKGDIVLVPGGNGMIGGLLSQVTPAQRYAHCGIMTKNFVEISHSTASQDWLVQEHPRGIYSGGKKQPTDGFEPDALRFQWPGGITQSVAEAYGGSQFTSPEGKQFGISAFNLVDAAVLDGQWQIIEPMVIKPHPLAELADPTIRQRLHKVADEARKLTVTAADTAAGRQSGTHYRFYSYSDSAVALRPSPSGVVGPAPASAGWAAGTVPSECASFIWLAAKRAGIQLEGPGAVTAPGDLEPADVLGGAQTDGETLDGLYFYTAEERARAARWFVPYIEETIFNKVVKEEGWLVAALNELFSDVGDDCAYQLANTFAFDWADGDSKNDDRWENPGIGRAISPDHLMLWDRPDQTGFGLWGYAEPLIHHTTRLELVPETKWRKTNGPALLNGTVVFNGARMAGVEVNAGGVTAITNADGWFSMDVFEGRYALKASKFIDREIGVAEAVLDLTVAAGEVKTIEVQLAPPPERYRLLQVDAQIEMNDDETFGDDHFSDHKYWELPVGPGHTVHQISFTRGWGGELRVEMTLTALYNPDDLSVGLQFAGKLYEGTSEQTDDLGGTAGNFWTIPKDAIKTTRAADGRELKIKITNTEDDVDDDYIEFAFTITNRRQA